MDKPLASSQHAMPPSEANYRLGIAVAGVGLGSMDYVADTITLDETAASLFALQAHTPVSRSDVHARFHPDEVAKIAGLIVDLLDPAGSGFMALDHRIITPDGSIRWVSARKQVEFATDADGLRRPTSGLLAVLDITERKRAELAQHQNAALFFNLIEQAPMGMYVVDAQFRIQQVNAVAMPVFATLQPLIGRDFTEAIKILWGPEVREEIARTFRHTLETGERYVSPPFSNQRHDLDVEQSYEWETQRITLPGGKYGVVCYFRDVTEHSRTEQTVRDSEAKFRATFNNAAVGIAHVGPDGTWLDVNARLCEFTGYSHDEILAKTFQDITHPDDLEADLENVNKLGRAETDSYSMDKRYIRKDGTVVWANLTVGCVRDAGGAIEYFVSVIEDISDRKAGEHALRETAERVRLALAAGGLGAWDLDLVTQIAHGDDGISRIFGTASADITLTDFLSLIHEDDVEDVKAALAQSANPDGNGHIEFECRIRRPNDGVERWINSHGQTSFQNGRPVRMIGVTQDITDRKKADEHIRLLMSEVNHRSKNLLSVVQAVARQTARRGDPSTFVARLAERIDGLSASQDLLVRNEWKGVDVVDLVTAQLAHFKDLIGRRVIIGGPPARLTSAAAQGVGMALHELTTNAAKYGALSNSAGTVHIEWQVTGDVTPAFSISWLEQGGPPVTAPSQSGFGQTVIGRMAESTVSGSAVIDYRESGLYWTLSAPVETTLEPR